jgi:lysosomal acid lipase/cholesteryl ester hydrolase
VLRIISTTRIFKLLQYIYFDDFLYIGASLARVVHYFCNKFTFICKTVINLIVETGVTNRVDYTKIHELYYYEPGGTSTKNMLHWVQVYDSKVVGEFDYGEKENIKVYGQRIPPTFDLSKFNKYKIKSWITRSDADPFSDVKDTTDFVNLVMDKSLVTVKDLKNYNHLDYLWSRDAVEDIYNEVLHFLAEK